MRIRRAISALILVPFIAGCGDVTANDSAERRSSRAEPTITSPEGMTVEFAADAEAYRFSSLDDLRESSNVIVEGEITAATFIEPVQVDTQRWEPRLLELRVDAVLHGNYDGDAVRVYDANRMTMKDGTTKLAVFVDSEIVEGDRVIAALIQDTVQAGAYTVNSSSAYFKLSPEGRTLTAFERDNPVAAEAQRLTPEELRTALSD